MAEILPIRRKTLSNLSINQSKMTVVVSMPLKLPFQISFHHFFNCLGNAAEQNILISQNFHQKDVYLSIVLVDTTPFE